MKSNTRRRQSNCCLTPTETAPTSAAGWAPLITSQLGDFIPWETPGRSKEKEEGGLQACWLECGGQSCLVYFWMWIKQASWNKDVVWAGARRGREQGKLCAEERRGLDVLAWRTENWKIQRGHWFRKVRSLKCFSLALRIEKSVISYFCNISTLKCGFILQKLIK